MMGKQVKLTLSTAKPAVGGKPPDLGRLVIHQRPSYSNDPQPLTFNYGGSSSSSQDDKSTSTTFTIPRSATLASDNKHHKVPFPSLHSLLVLLVKWVVLTMNVMCNV